MSWGHSNMSSVSNSYIKQVLKQVKFIVDHRSIRRELNSHIQDLIDEHQWHNLSEYDLNIKIHEEMGNPIDLGQSLNQVHKPILGYLWVVSRSMFIIILCFTLNNLYQTIVGTSFIKKSSSDVNLDVRQVVKAVGELKKTDYSNKQFKDWDIHVVKELAYSKIIFERIILLDDNNMLLLYRSERKFDLFNRYNNLFMYNSLKLKTETGIQYVQDMNVQMWMNDLMISYFVDVPYDSKELTFNFNQVSESFNFIVKGSENEQKN